MRNLMILAVLTATILPLVSSQSQLNRQLRYVLAVLGIALVFAGPVAWWFELGCTRR